MSGLIVNITIHPIKTYIEVVSHLGAFIHNAAISELKIAKNQITPNNGHPIVDLNAVKQIGVYDAAITKLIIIWSSFLNTLMPLSLMFSQ